MQQSAMTTLASLRLTLGGFVLLAVGVLHFYLNAASVYWLVAPLALLALNLLAALIGNPRFRRQGGLLVFHIGLLLLLVLAAAGQMLGFTGQAEIVAGQRFRDAVVTPMRVGPWHDSARLASVDFVQGDFTVEYAPLLVRGRTQSTVLAAAKTGQARSVTVGDRVPYVERGYRFSTTPNKGFALVLTWSAEGAGPVTGAVHLPSFPLRDWNQIATWSTPAGEALDLELEPSVSVRDDAEWVLDSRGAGGRLWLTAGGQRRALEVGESAFLSGGTLRFEAVRMWMGYQVYYDPTLPWLLAASLIAVVGLAWHFWGKLWSRPLNDGRKSARERGVAFGI